MNKKVLLIIFIVSCICVLVSPFLFPIQVSSFSELKELKFGFPFPFIEQTSSYLPNKKDFPLSIKMLNPLENVTQISLGNLALSIVNVMIFISLFVFLVDRMILKRKRLVRSKVNN